MSNLSEDKTVLAEAIAVGVQSVGPHMEIVEEQMRAAGVNGAPLISMAELRESAQGATDAISAFLKALEKEGTTVGQAHAESPNAARKGAYYSTDDD
ncbi:hypothetical protein [Nocardiopsis dassonvillei]|uniref:hypothetical protein n=1 Tax=Nocardiopsis dassonvillei TaxID=2014 RepID=UPI00157D20F3|nr:hypothetical protein [Nocardiopsis dassonvillei]